MTKKCFVYKNFCSDIWYTDSLKNWFIVKENNLFVLKKGSIVNDTTIELGNKIFKKYQRLGDAKVGLENHCKTYVATIKKQEAIFNELQKTKKMDNISLDYFVLDKEVERLKEKWGVR